MMKMIDVGELSKFGQFSVHYIYVDLRSRQVRVPYRKISFLKTRLNLKVFMWLALRKGILTKEVLLHLY